MGSITVGDDDEVDITDEDDDCYSETMSFAIDGYTFFPHFTFN